MNIILLHKVGELQNKKITLSDLDQSIWPEKIEKVDSYKDSITVNGMKINQPYYLVTYKIAKGYVIGDPDGGYVPQQIFVANHMYLIDNDGNIKDPFTEKNSTFLSIED